MKLIQIDKDSERLVIFSIAALEDFRHKYAFDAALYEKGVEMTTHAQKSFEMVEKANRAIEMYKNWLAPEEEQDPSQIKMF